MVRLVAVDVGQSGSRVRSSDGLELQTGPAFDPDTGLLGTIRQVLASAGNPRADVLALSMTGLRGVVPDPREIGECCYGLTGAHSVALADDGLAAQVGALGNTDGVVLAVGSGSVAVARCEDRTAHRDGDGALLGDDGSGFWIGRAGLRAALRALEQRGPATLLSDLLSTQFGSLHVAVRTRSDKELMQWCIDTSPVVLAAAASGDEVATQIRRRGVERLAATAASAWRAVCDDERIADVSFTGGVVRDSEFRTLLASGLREAIPGARIVEALGDNLDGALAIATSEPVDLPPLLRWWHH